MHTLHGFHWSDTLEPSNCRPALWIRRHCYFLCFFFHRPPWPPDFMSASSCSSIAKPARRCVRRSALPAPRSCGHHMARPVKESCSQDVAAVAPNALSRTTIATGMPVAGCHQAGIHKQARVKRHGSAHHMGPICNSMKWHVCAGCCFRQRQWTA